MINRNNVETALALLVIQEIPADLYARVCAYFDTEARGCTYEQIKAYMRHMLTNYDALRKMYQMKGNDYVQFKNEVIRRTEESYARWRESREENERQ